MRILLFGQQGQVGWELQRALAPLGEVMGLDRSSPMACGDLANTAGVAQTIREWRPDVVVNAAAYTAVDRAEAEPEVARLINATAPATMAAECRALGALLVHYSTDYVFDGSGQEARTETAQTGPLNVYGATKLEAEQVIVDSGCQHLIMRTSWVYGTRGANFAKTMLRLAQERERLTVIDDQVGAPTGADLIADVTAHAIRAAVHQSHLQGIYHLVASGETTWHGYASCVIDEAKRLQPDAGWCVREVAPVPTTAFPTPAKRPLNSRMDNRKIQGAMGLVMPDWRTGVLRMLGEIYA